MGRLRGDRNRRPMPKGQTSNNSGFFRKHNQRKLKPKKGQKEGNEREGTMALG